MKTVRQVAILDIIEKQEIETQEELASSLNARGIRVTQATVSRDIKELRLLKVLTPSEVLGTLAGDNTVLLIIRSNEETITVTSRIREMMK